MATDHSGHRDRVKEKFLKTGLESFHDHEIIELILYYALKQGDTNPVAHELVKKFGSLSAVLDAPYEELLKVNGVGKHCAILLKMFPHVSRAYSIDKEKGAVINSTEKAGAFICPLFIGRTAETFVLVCVDSKCKVLSTQVLSQGDVSSTHVNIRVLVETALKCNAFGVFIAHNHPGGFALPTKDDQLVTKKIYDALHLMNIELIDHIIVADNDFISFADSDLLKYKKL